MSDMHGKAARAAENEAGVERMKTERRVTVANITSQRSLDEWMAPLLDCASCKSQKW
jgi:hypothetical protein